MTKGVGVLVFNRRIAISSNYVVGGYNTKHTLNVLRIIWMMYKIFQAKETKNILIRVNVGT